MQNIFACRSKVKLWKAAKQLISGAFHPAHKQPVEAQAKQGRETEPKQHRNPISDSPAAVWVAAGNKALTVCPLPILVLLGKIKVLLSANLCTIKQLSVIRESGAKRKGPQCKVLQTGTLFPVIFSLFTYKGKEGENKKGQRDEKGEGEEGWLRVSFDRNVRCVGLLGEERLKWVSKTSEFCLKVLSWAPGHITPLALTLCPSQFSLLGWSRIENLSLRSRDWSALQRKNKIDTSLPPLAAFLMVFLIKDTLSI